MTTATAAPPATRRRTSVETCPYCGQPLLDPDAVLHVHESEKEFERKLDEAANVLAAQLAKAQTAKLESRLAASEAKLATSESEHKQQLRDLRITVRAEAQAEAQRDAAAKVRTELRQKDRAIEQFREQIEVQQRQIDHLTSDERGELNELQLVAELQAAFPTDRIERRGRGRAGGDILHEVCVSSGDGPVKAGVIVYECKDTKAWSNGFLEQVRKEGLTHKTPYLVIVTHAFPRGEKTLTVKKGIVIVHPTRAVDLARVMRRMVEEVHKASLTSQGQASKSAELYEYLAGGEFRRAFDAVAGGSDSLIELLGKERKWHEGTWIKRQAIYNDLASKTTAIDTEIRRVIEKKSPQKGGTVVELRRTS